MNKQFTTAARQTKDEGFEGAEPITFNIDNDEFTASPPTASQFALFMAGQSSHSTVSDQIAAMIDFFNGMLPEDQQLLLRHRLLNRDDALDFETIQQVMEFLIEEWSARPTS